MKLFGPRVKKTTAGQIAKKFNLELHGDVATLITGIAPIADAKPGDITFYSTERNVDVFKILPISVLKNTKATTIIIQPENVKYAPKGATLLVTESPRAQVIKVLDFLLEEPVKRGISHDAIICRGVFFRKKKSVYIEPFVIIEKGARIEENVRIMSGAYIGKNCRLGKNTIVHSNAVIENADIGDNCVIHNGASIGKDGFGFVRKDGKNVFISHAGRVVIGNDVSIGANTCIDRGMLTDTKIGNGTKVDNLVQIAHGVVVGEHVFLAAGVGLPGGVVIGDRAMLGGQVGVNNGLHIGDDAQIGGKSMVLSNIPKGERWVGVPAFKGRNFMRMMVWLHNQVIKTGKK